MGLQFTVEPINGILHIVSGWEHNWSIPVEYRNGWSTGLRADDYAELAGRNAEPFGDSWRIVTAAGTCRFVNTVGGPHAKATHYEERPVKKPRNMNRWRDGKWVK